MRIFVSRPRTVVTCGAPERTSRHIAALLRGCDVWRCASAGGEECCGVGAGVGVWVCAYDRLAAANQGAATTSARTGIDAASRVMMCLAAPLVWERPRPRELEPRPLAARRPRNPNPTARHFSTRAPHAW